MKDVLKVIGVVRLAADPELRSLPSGSSVCKLRVAWNTSRKDGATGEWSDVGHFMDLTVWGAQGEACARYLTKGRQVVIEARLETRSWEDKESGQKRYGTELVAEQVQFVGGGDSNGGGFSARDDAPGDDGADFAPPEAASPAPVDDDIPF